MEGECASRNGGSWDMTTTKTTKATKATTTRKRATRPQKFDSTVNADMWSRFGRGLVAYHDDVKVKQDYLARVRAHQKADELVQGYGYWKDGKGCAVGCTIHGGEHKSYETELGVPRILARLEDGIFERLPKARAQKWPEEFLRAVPVGADLSRVWPEFARWLLVDKKWGVVRFAKMDAARSAIERVAELYGKVLAGEVVTVEIWRKAKRNAAAYAAHAAYAAVAHAAHAAYAAVAHAAHAAYAAYAASDAAYAYAAYAADAAYAAAADAKQKHTIAQANKLLALIRRAPAASSQKRLRKIKCNG